MKRGGSNLSKLVNVDNLIILVVVVLVCVSVVLYLKNSKEHFRWYGKRKAIRRFKRNNQRNLNTFKEDMQGFLYNYLVLPNDKRRAAIRNSIIAGAQSGGFKPNGELGCNNEWANIYNYLRTVGLWTEDYKSVWLNDLFEALHDEGKDKDCDEHQSLV